MPRPRTSTQTSAVSSRPADGVANTFRVVLDACVMIPQNLNNLLLTLADHELFTPVWSDHLLDEVRRNLVVKIGIAAERADHRIAAMREAFPHAVDHSSGYLELRDAMKNHPKDRHVLAAAVASNAQLIVTANIRDFPASACDLHGVVAVHPDDFLLDQLDLDPQRVIAAISDLIGRNRRAPCTMSEFVDAIRPTIPQFAAALQAMLQPVPLLEIVDDEDVERQFIQTDDPAAALRDPLNAARLWWQCLTQREAYPYAVGNVSINPQHWDFDTASQLLDGYALTTGVHDDNNREDVVYIKFIPDTGHSMRAFGDFVIDDYRVLAMRRHPEGYWLAEGLFYDTWPSTANPRTRSKSVE